MKEAEKKRGVSRIAKGQKRDQCYFNTCAENEPRLDLCKKCTCIDDCPVRESALEVKNRQH